MMQAIKQSRPSCGQDKWYVVSQVSGQQDAAWAFDRLRLYYPNKCTKVAIFYDLTPYTAEDGRLIIERVPDLIQPFSTDLGFEHDFTFDLSTDTANCYFAISHIPDTASFQQIYASPTGFGATRNKHAKPFSWDFSIINPVVNIGGADTSMYFNNIAVFQEIQWRHTLSTPAIYAKTLRFENSNLSAASIDNLINWADAGGVSNGTMNYSGNPNVPTVASRPAYDRLIAKTWAITGTPPPTS